MDVLLTASLRLQGSARGGGEACWGSSTPLLHGSPAAFGVPVLLVSCFSLNHLLPSAFARPQLPAPLQERS